MTNEPVHTTAIVYWNKEFLFYDGDSAKEGRPTIVKITKEQFFTPSINKRYGLGVVIYLLADDN